MTESKIEVGTIVRHPNRPAWGPGKTLEIGGGGQVTVYFRDIEETKAGDAVKTLSTNVVGLDIAPEQTDLMLDSVPPFTKGRFEGVKKPRLSLDHAVQAFVDLHPGAFEDPAYREKTRTPAEAAHALWVELLGDGKGSQLLDEGNLDEAVQRLSRIGATAGLLSLDEKKALQEALTDEETAEPFLRSLFKVVDEATPERSSYQQLINALGDLPEEGGATRVSWWTVLTVFPFVACPEHHIQLKPVVAQKCASRLNFDLRYTPGLNWWTYDRLLAMAGILHDRLAPLGARDFIDVQSFVRVIASV